MEAIYIGNDTNWWRTRPGPNHTRQQQGQQQGQQQQGPFIMADFEDGMFAGACVPVSQSVAPSNGAYPQCQEEGRKEQCHLA